MELPGRCRGDPARERAVRPGVLRFIPTGCQGGHRLPAGMERCRISRRRRAVPKKPAPYGRPASRKTQSLWFCARPAPQAQHMINAAARFADEVLFRLAEGIEKGVGLARLPGSQRFAVFSVSNQVRFERLAFCHVKAVFAVPSRNVEKPSSFECLLQITCCMKLLHHVSGSAFLLLCFRSFRAPSIPAACGAAGRGAGNDAGQRHGGLTPVYAGGHGAG